MAKIVAMGEMLMRLSPVGYQKLVQAQPFDVYYGGSEANVLISLACMGQETRYVSRLPKNDLGYAARNTLRHWGVDTDVLAWGGNRLGIYYMEQGAAIRPSNVVYDRAGSAAAGMEPCMFDWSKVFDGADWFHFSGITPAISASAAETVAAAVKAAKAMGLTVSCDLNYRSKLWTPEECQKVMIPLMKYVDVVLASADDCADCLGVKLSGRGMWEDAEEAAYAVSETYGIKTVAVMMRENHDVLNKGWCALLLQDGTLVKSRKLGLNTVDIVGTGDAFMAGFIYGLKAGRGPAFTLDYALTASALEQSIPGDFNVVSTDEILSVMGADAVQDIRR